MSEAKEKKLLDKIQLLEAKVEELEIEVSTAKKYVLSLYPNQTVLQILLLCSLGR